MFLAQPHCHFLLQAVTQVKGGLGTKQSEIVEHRRLVTQTARKRCHRAGVDHQETRTVIKKVIQMQIKLPLTGGIEAKQTIQQGLGEHQPLIAQRRLAGAAIYPITDQHRAVTVTGFETNRGGSHSGFNQGTLTGAFPPRLLVVTSEEQLGEHGFTPPACLYRNAPTGQMAKHSLGVQKLTVQFESERAGGAPAKYGQIKPGQPGNRGFSDQFALLLRFIKLTT